MYFLAFLADLDSPDAVPFWDRATAYPGRDQQHRPPAGRVDAGRQQRLDEIAPGILQLVQGQTPVQNTLNPAFRRTMVELAVLLVLQLAGLLWSLRRFWRWVRHPESAPRKVVRILGVVLPGLVISLALVALLWYMGPVSSHRSFSVQALGAPDQMLLLGSNIVLALIGAILQVIKGIWLWRS